jgi:roadblock/LC7 domain-containing protein
MMHSEQIDQIAAAISVLQSRMRTVDKSASNPFFKSRYTPLEDVVDSIRPHLEELGLSFTQGGTLVGANGESEAGFKTEFRMVLSTCIMHKSGQWIESFFPLDAVPDKNGVVTPQGWGSASSYARRYGLQAALGITTGDVDDDGNLASGNESIAPVMAKMAASASAPNSVRNNDWAALWAIVDAKGLRKQVDALRTKGFAAVAEAAGINILQ